MNLISSLCWELVIRKPEIMRIRTQYENQIFWEGKMFEDRDILQTQGDNKEFLKLSSQLREFKTYVRIFFLFLMADIVIHLFEFVVQSFWS